MARFYTRITCWENKRRLATLTQFRHLLDRYLKNTEYHWMADGRIENEAARETRVQLNRLLDEVHKVVNLANINPSVTYTPPPAVGGYIQRVDLIINLFNLDRFDIPASSVFDYVDRALGVYERNRRPALWRTINPFFWLGGIFDYVVQLPFLLLGRAGFNRAKLEDSTLGRFVKAVLYLISVLASLLTIFQLTGYLDWFNKLIRRIFTV